MKNLQKHLLIVFLVATTINVSAQPYTLDEKIKPVRLELKNNPELKGGKIFEDSYEIGSDDTHRYYVKGHDIFQLVDVYIFAHSGSHTLKAELVKNSWKTIEETKNSKSAEDGIINFKLRSYSDFGFAITTQENSNVEYSIIISASVPLKNYLGSPFIKATPANSGIVEAGTPSISTINGESNKVIYIIIGVLVLIIGFLAGKLIGVKKTANSLLLLALLSIPNAVFSQIPSPEEVVENRRRLKEQQDKFNERRTKIMENISNGLGVVEDGKSFYEQYTGLGDCMRSAPPPGQPRIPSFCTEIDGDCAACYTSARTKFNEVRYTFEQLQTIYDCTKQYTDAGIAFGDNVAGVFNGVSGLAWQKERMKLLQSIKKLNKTYDNKRAELLRKLNESLKELDACEQQHGIPDWYDRFGVLFYDFIEMRYHR